MSDIPGNFMDFPHIRNLIEKQETDRVHEFNLMLVGEKGVGKSTLVKSLFKGKIKPDESNQGPRICEYSELLEENGVRLKLVCVETSNFKMHNPGEYTKYIDEQFRKYFKDAKKYGFKNIKDTRIHCCLYLIPNYGKMELDKDDIECMKALHEKVNLVPIIARADLFNDHQKEKFKENIMRDLELNNIKYFQFNFPKEEDEDRHNIVNSEMSRFPFAVVAADEPTYDKENNKVLWIRRSGGGDIDILDRTKCDFVSLSKLLIKHCMVDLMDATYGKHYPKFKRDFLKPEVRNQDLKSIGLEKHEIEFLEYCLNPRVTKPLTVHEIARDQQKMERELAEMKLKIRHLKILKAQRKKD